MPVAHHVSHLRRHHGLDPGLDEFPIGGKIDFRDTGGGCEPSFVFRRVAAHGANVVERTLFATHNPLPDNQIGVCGIRASRLERCFIEPGRQYVDQIDIAGEFAVLFLGHASRHEDSEMPDGFVDRVDDRLPVGPDLVDVGIEAKNPV